MRRILLVLLMAVVVAACGNEGSTSEAPATSGAVAKVTAGIAATPTEAVRVTPTQTNAAPVEATATFSPPATASATLAPVIATQQALLGQVTLVPRNAGTRTPIGADDYPALVDQACTIVSENYLRDDYNGVDWDATCADYRARAQEIDHQEAFWDQMAELIGELDDDHSRFVRPDDFAGEFRLPQEGAGIPWPGLELSSVSGTDRVVVWNVCETGPAASRGVRTGDVVLAIDGESVRGGPDGLDRRAISEMLYQAGKDEVTLTILPGPGAEAREVTIVYGGASGCDGWRYGVLSNNPRIGYVRMPSFGNEAPSNVMTMIEWLEEDGALDGLVVDVRHNPGGNADDVIQIFTSGIFGRVGPLREGGTQTIWRIRGPVRWNETTPVVVLIDGASASAPEYFAIAMQLSGRATLVGAATAGNMEGIRGFNLADGSLIRLGVSTLQLEDGSTLEGRGVQPDLVVPMGEWGRRQTPDVQVQAAIDFLLNSIGGG